MNAVDESDPACIQRHAKTNTATQLAIGRERDRETRFQNGFRRVGFDEILGILLGVGMRDAQSGGRDFTGACEADEVGNVC